MDRLTRVVAHDGTATLYEYDVNGNRTAVCYANGIVVTCEYDEVNRLILEKALDKDGGLVAQYVYTLGAAGERLKIEELDRTVEYEYDELYRLTKETVTDENGTTVTSYTYDKNSNRLTKNTDGVITSYTYNELNQIVSETGIAYTYDLNGNLKTKTEAEQTTTYTYNAQNRLIRVTIQSGQQVNVEEYLYDFAGNRIAKATELGKTYYLVDTNGALSQVLAEYDENGSLTVNYTRGAELISQERNGTKSYYLHDGHDSVRMLTNADGVVTDTYTFDAFGNLTASTGNTENSYLYCGEQFDSFTGLYYLRARYMNPSTGTFITMDEYAGSVFEPVSLHKYLYANANPVMNSDPSGYFTLGSMTVAMNVQTAINRMYSAHVSGMISGLFSMLYTYLSGGTITDMLESFSSGYTIGFISNGLNQLGKTIKAVRVFMAITSLGSVGAGYYQAYLDYQKGNKAACNYLVAMSSIGLIGWVCEYGPDVKNIINDIRNPKPTYIGPDFNPNGPKYQEGIDPNSLKPQKDLSTLDPQRQADAVRFGGDKLIEVDHNGVIQDGHHRVNDAIANNKSVDVYIVY